MTPDRFAEVGVDSVEGHPVWVLRRGVRQAIAAIEAEHAEPERRLWRVRLRSGERLLLIRRGVEGPWGVTPVAPPYGPAAV
jgi:hypothetical protein